MFAGLHWTAWLLLVISFGLGLGIVLVSFFSHKKRSKSDKNFNKTG